MTEVKIDKWLDNDTWAKVRKEWDGTPTEEKEAFYRRNAAIIDRWQAETDAMAKEDNTDEKKE